MTRTKFSQTTGYFAPLAGNKYMLLTTFRRDGTGVSTPVHVVVDGDAAFFRTWDVSGKAKRLRRTAAVHVAPCKMRGGRKGPDLAASAVLLEGDESRQAAEKLAREHRILHGYLIPWAHRLRGWKTQQYRLTPP